MEYSITWQIENRVVFINYGQSVTIDDMIAINNTLMSFLEDGNPPVHIIFDVTELRDFPVQLKKAKEILSHLKHPNMGWLVGYGMNPIMGFLTTTIANMFGIQARSVKSHDEALQVLNRVDLTLA